ncbi:MAG: glucose-6-phosphate dehydrogenase [Acidocella sp.]|nr:glucose-6-phosphate dehydrogenase [Acidocella sp.]
MMTSRVIPVVPFVLVVFGVTGDLARRKLIPAMFQRDVAGQLPGDATILGVSRGPLTEADYIAMARQAVLDHVPEAERSEADIERFVERLRYVSAQADSDAGWDHLAAVLKPFSDRVQVFYLATGPGLFAPICERLGRFGLAGANARVVVEKPIGKDLESARLVNEGVGKVFPEDRVYRIDHYLGKEAVQNLMALRFANGLFEPLWNAAHIDHVQITVAESLGVEGRAGYYDNAGALRDMVQNHILQLLCLVAMEPPARLKADAVRDEKLKVLRALKPVDDALSTHAVVRGQYRAGASAGGAVPGYLDELGADTSTTETFVALKAEIENWRWAGVPFYLRTGKRLAERVSEIVIAFRPIPHSVFDEQAGTIVANRLVIRLQPDEGVKLWLMTKDPGPGGMRLRQVPLDMSFATTFQVRNPDAYERLVLDVVRGDQTLFMRRDEVEAAWTWIDPILKAWSESGELPKPYTAGTWGPSAAIALIERDGRTWLDGGS